MFWIACIFMGLIFIYRPLGDTSMDASVYVERIEAGYANTDNSLSDVIESAYSTGSTTPDIYERILVYLVSRFTGNGHIFFAIGAMIFGFFYSRNLWYIFDRLPAKVGFYIGISIIFFMYINPMHTVGGIRMNTALHVFAYGAMPFILEKDKSKTIWCLLAPLFHFSFIAATAMFLVYLLLPKRDTIILPLFILYIITFFINSLNLESVNMFLKQYTTQEILESKIDGYANTNAAISRMEHFKEYNAFIQFMRSYSKYLVFFIMLSCSYCWLKVRTKATTRLFAFSLLFFSFANIASSIPSGSRFINIGLMFLTPLYIFNMVIIKTNLYNKLKYCALLWIPSIVLAIRIDFGSFGITALVTNFLTTPFFETDVPLIVFVKQLLYV
ncbi:MAG: EpsG family protein [Rikenellaceae bacterium]